MTADSVTVHEISGVRALVGPTGGDEIVSLRFRVGQADETLATRGFSHLAEHLALGSFRDVSYAFQGTTGPTSTMFAAVASPEKQVEFVNGIASHLYAIASGETPEVEILHEAKVLSAEQDQRDLGLTGAMLSHMYGATGLGLIGWHEYGLHDLDIEIFRSWVGDRFCRSNAVLAFHNDVSPSIDLGPLAVGQPTPPLVPHALVESLPGFIRHPGPLGIVASVERDNGGQAMTSILTKELTETLRHTLGASYAPAVSYAPVSSQHAMVLGMSDIKAEHATAGAEAMVNAISRLANDGPMQSEVEHQRDTWFETNRRVGSAASLLEWAAEAVLYGEEPKSRTEIEHQWAELDGVLVQKMAARLADSYLLSVPGNAQLEDDRVTPVPEHPHDAPVRGRRIEYNVQKGAVGPLGPPSLYVGDDGVTLTNGAVRTSTILKDEAALMLCYSDGTRTLLGSRGQGIMLVPNRWHGTSSVIIRFEKWIESHQIKHIGFRSMAPDGWDIKPRFCRQKMLARVAMALVPILFLVFLILPVGLSVGEKFTTFPLAAVVAACCWWLSNQSDNDPIEKMVHHVDSAGWHAGDPQFGANRLTKQAYVRGGLLLSWIVKYDFLAFWVQDSAAEELQQYRQEVLTAGELYKEMDGMLATDMVKPEARKFIVWLHSPQGGKEPRSRIAAIYEELATGLANPYDLEDDPATEQAFDEALRRQMWRGGFAVVDHESFKMLWRRTG